MNAHSALAEPEPTDPDLPRTVRVAAYGVVRRGGTVLLCRCSPGDQEAGMWTLPGGGLDFGERPEDGAIREVSEETGLVAVINGPPYVVSETGIWRRSSGAVRFHQVRVIYPMTVTGGMERVEVEGSTDAIEWVSWPLVEPRPLVGFVQPILDRAIGDATGPSMRHRTRGLR